MHTSGTMIVPIMKLDDFITENKITKLDFLKMDIEGYEPSVIEGAKQTLKTFKPHLYIEIHPKLTCQVDTKSIKNMLIELKEFGYETEQVDCAMRLENLSITDLIEDNRVKDSTKEEKQTGRKATFEVFFKHKDR